MTEEEDNGERPMKDVFKEVGLKYAEDLAEIDKLFDTSQLPDTKFKVAVVEDMENNTLNRLLMSVNGDAPIREAARGCRIFYIYLTETYGFTPEQAIYLVHGYLGGGRM